MPGSEALIFVSPLEIVISVAPLAVVAWVSYVMGLDIESPILVGSLRTYVQLSILGFILEALFVRGVEHWWLVVGYCMLMILLASYEASVRSKYYVDGQFWMVTLPIVTNIVVVSMFAFCLVLKPEPRWGESFCSAFPWCCSMLTRHQCLINRSLALVCYTIDNNQTLNMSFRSWVSFAATNYRV